jgi:hypothetical protein
MFDELASDGGTYSYSLERTTVTWSEKGLSAVIVISLNVSLSLHHSKVIGV